VVWWAVGERQGKVHLVHRLDKPASGCLLAALSAPWAALLQRCMTHPSANKTYLGTRTAHARTHARAHTHAHAHNDAHAT
jgi:23S rRNA-/tRNA-specific pseudouridylate synthase